MIRAVLDTNVLASGFVRSNPAAAPVQLLDGWRDRAFMLVISEPILAELGHTFGDPYFARRLTPQQIEAILTLLRTEAIVTPLTATVRGVATHPEDDRMLATAESSQANYLVTGDRQLRKLGTYKGIAMVSPREFLDTPIAQGLL